MSAPRGPGTTADPSSGFAATGARSTIPAILARGEGLDEVLAAALVALASELPLASAVLVECRTGRLRVVVFHGEGASEASLSRAEANAHASYVLLAGPVPEPARGLEPRRIPAAFAPRADTRERPSPAAPASRRGNFMTLPLATERGAIFGCLQVEGTRELTERDLALVGFFTAELSRALDLRARAPGGACPEIREHPDDFSRKQGGAET